MFVFFLWDSDTKKQYNTPQHTHLRYTNEETLQYVMFINEFCWCVWCTARRTSVRSLFLLHRLTWTQIITLNTRWKAHNQLWVIFCGNTLALSEWTALRCRCSFLSIHDEIRPLFFSAPFKPHGKEVFEQWWWQRRPCASPRSLEFVCENCVTVSFSRNSGFREFAFI